MNRWRLLLAAALVTAGCGITPSAALERTTPPVITLPASHKRIWLIKNGQVAYAVADPADDSVGSLLRALFDASERPLPEDTTTALRKFSLDRVHNSQDPVLRDEIAPPRTVSLIVYISGTGKLTRLAKAQIVCTAQEDTTVNRVKIVRRIDGQGDKSEGNRSCEDLR